METTNRTISINFKDTYYDKEIADNLINCINKEIESAGYTAKVIDDKPSFWSKHKALILEIAICSVINLLCLFLGYFIGRYCL